MSEDSLEADAALLPVDADELPAEDLEDFYVFLGSIWDDGCYFKICY